MPKMKTKSGAKKRFKMTATGRVKAGVAGKRHRLLSHDADYIRSHRGTKILKKGDESLVKCTCRTIAKEPLRCPASREALPPTPATRRF